jgi:protein-serine/threonine kinase
MIKLKRSKKSVDGPGSTERNPRIEGRGEACPVPQRPRPKRGFSLSGLTYSIGIRKHSRKSINKESISRPIINPHQPIVAPSSSTVLGEVSPPPSIYVSPSVISTPHGSVRASTTGTSPYYKHSASNTTKFWFRPTIPQPWFHPSANRTGRNGSGYELPRTELPVSPIAFHRAINTLGALNILENLKNMEPARLQPPVTGTKARALQQAKEMQDLVAERAKRSGDEPPPYDFYELIGKGSYGRVFKGQNRNTGGLVAIKIIDIDKVDYEEMTTKNLSETLKEIDILQQLRDSKARPYVNIIEEARSVHNELWIVSEYASGGSVATLMKPCMVKEPFGLEEKFIIPIARELALGLKYTHEAGVLHRDLKCT